MFQLVTLLCATQSSQWYDEEDYDVVVVGAGHAGCEAALASARLGCRTLLLTLNLDRIAWQVSTYILFGGASQALKSIEHSMPIICL